MGILGDLFSIGASIVGHKSDKAKNRRADEELKIQRDLSNQQIDLSKYIQSLSKGLMDQGSGMVDPYGGTTTYNPITKRWETTMGEIPRALQGASDAEEAQRLTVDQAMRRRALQEMEGRRAAAGGEATTAIGDLSRFKQGVGRIDPAQLAATMRLDRQGAVNAGYDDAERAATKLQLRTGSSAVGDALSNLARDRVRAQAEIGNPEVEALQIAEGINTGRSSNLAGLYDMFNANANNVYDASFTPAPYAEIAAARGQDAQKLDLSRYEVGMGGSGTAAAGIGSAAAGLRQGYQLSEANRIHSPTGALLRGIGANADSLAASLAKLFPGG